MQDALWWTEKLIAFAVLLQTIEYFKIQLPNLNFLFLGLRLMAAVGLLFSSHFLFPAILLLSTLWIGYRLRGPFNGGSDYMTVAVLLGLTIASINNGSAQSAEAGLWYIGLQTSFSYFLAGFAKARNSDWWNGRALQLMLSQAQPHFTNLRSQKHLLILFSLAVLIFECFFPLAFVFPEGVTFFLVVGILFHLLNFFAFGLNRFFWAWISTYPALFYCISTHIFH